jgi:hypothetical protein
MPGYIHSPAFYYVKACTRKLIRLASAQASPQPPQRKPCYVCKIFLMRVYIKSSFLPVSPINIGREVVKQYISIASFSRAIFEEM